MRAGLGEARDARMQPTAAAHAAAAAAAQQHNHLINVHYPETAPPSLTPRKRNCGCTLGLIALLLVLIFVALLALESPFIALENSRIAARMRAAPYRREHPPTPPPSPSRSGSGTSARASRRSSSSCA